MVYKKWYPGRPAISTDLGLADFRIHGFQKCGIGPTSNPLDPTGAQLKAGFGLGPWISMDFCIFKGSCNGRNEKFWERGRETEPLQIRRADCMFSFLFIFIITDPDSSALR